MTDPPSHVGRLIGAAKRYEAAISARGATRTNAEWVAATPAVDEAVTQLHDAVLDLGVVIWLARLDD